LHGHRSDLGVRLRAHGDLREGLERYVNWIRQKGQIAEHFSHALENLQPTVVARSNALKAKA